MRDKITKRTVEGIAPSLRDTVLWDTEIPGFGCKITPKGTRIYVLQHSQRGRDHRVTIGRHGVEFTPDKLGTRHGAYAALSPREETPHCYDPESDQSQRLPNRGRAILRNMLDQTRSRRLSLKTCAICETTSFRYIGSLRASEIERQDITRLMRDIAAGKTATQTRSR